MSSDQHLKKGSQKFESTIDLPVSKSECNRALIISFLSGRAVTVKNHSDARDSVTMNDLLSVISDAKISYLNCGPAGTTFRFILGVAAITPGEWTLTGSDRMKERPIGILVDALRSMGAEITYLEKEGFPPLKISGKKLNGGTLHLDAGVSSQFVSSLMMIGPLVSNGIDIHFTQQPVSLPYIKMTTSIMNQCGAKVILNEKSVQVLPELFYHKHEFICENDWSAASYFYALVAVNKKLKIHLPGLRKMSLQGDSVVRSIYAFFGVETIFTAEGITIYNNDSISTDYLEYDFTDCPDLAQTVAFTCAALRIEGKLTGLSTLKNKETDRIEALKTELTKCGMQCKTGTDFISFSANSPLSNSITFETYDDHRMAMASSVMALVCDDVIIKDEKVVEKSFPGFWKEIGKII